MRTAVARLGRVGRTVLYRIVTRSDRTGVQIALATHMAEIDVLAGQMRYRSVFGPLPSGAWVARSGL